jgi:hypothetical protein
MNTVTLWSTTHIFDRSNIRTGNRLCPTFYFVVLSCVGKGVPILPSAVQGTQFNALRRTVNVLGSVLNREIPGGLSGWHLVLQLPLNVKLVTSRPNTCSRLKPHSGVQQWLSHKTVLVGQLACGRACSWGCQRRLQSGNCVGNHPYKKWGNCVGKTRFSRHCLLLELCNPNQKL